MKRLLLILTMLAVSACSSATVEHIAKTKPAGPNPVANAEYQLKLVSKLEW